MIDHDMAAIITLTLTPSSQIIHSQTRTINLLMNKKYDY
jgi:hypothetical protein